MYCPALSRDCLSLYLKPHPYAPLLLFPPSLPLPHPHTRNRDPVSNLPGKNVFGGRNGELRASQDSLGGREGKTTTLNPHTCVWNKLSLIHVSKTFNWGKKKSFFVVVFFTCHPCWLCCQKPWKDVSAFSTQRTQTPNLGQIFCFKMQTRQWVKNPVDKRLA